MTYEKLQKYQPSRATYMGSGYGPIMSANRADDFSIRVGFDEKSEAITYMLMYLLKGSIRKTNQGWEVRFNPSDWDTNLRYPMYVG
jgi:hypothetical protein